MGVQEEQQKFNLDTFVISGHLSPKTVWTVISTNLICIQSEHSLGGIFLDGGAVLLRLFALCFGLAENRLVEIVEWRSIQRLYYSIYCTQARKCVRCLEAGVTSGGSELVRVVLALH